jgi:dipeptidyl aminopeptidase/acylaminoacyl peptidase
MVSRLRRSASCRKSKSGWLAVEPWRAPSGSKFRGTHRFMHGLVLLVALATVAAADEPAVENAPFLRVTTDGYFKQRPAWSPNGQHLVFARHRGATIFLFLRDLKSNQEERLTKSEHPEYDAIFAPNGKELLFAYDKASPNQGDIEVHSSGLRIARSKTGGDHRGQAFS